MYRPKEINATGNKRYCGSFVASVILPCLQWTRLFKRNFKLLLNGALKRLSNDGNKNVFFFIKKYTASL